jgi:hypothetical protein
MSRKQTGNLVTGKRCNQARRICRGLEVPKCETFAVKAARVPQIGPFKKTVEKVECLAESDKL